MIVAKLLWKIIFPFIAVSSVGYTVKSLYDVDWSSAESLKTSLVNIVGKVVVDSYDQSTDNVVDMMKDGKPNYYCDISTNKDTDNKAFCMIQKFEPTINKILNPQDIITSSYIVQKSTDFQDNDGTNYFSVSADSSKIKDFIYSPSQKLRVFSKENNKKIAEIKILYTYTNSIDDIEGSTNLIVVKSSSGASKYLDVIDNTIMCSLNNKKYKCNVFTKSGKISDLKAVKSLEISTTTKLAQKPEEDIEKDKYYIVDLQRLVSFKQLKNQNIEISAESKVQGNRIFRKPIGQKYEIMGYLTSSYQITYQTTTFTQEKNTIFLGEKKPTDAVV